MVVTLAVVFVMLLMVSFLMLIVKMFMVIFMERSMDVVFCDSIFWNLPPISASVQICKIDNRRDRCQESKSYLYELQCDR